MKEEKKIRDKKGRLVKAGGLVVKEENGQKYVVLLSRKKYGRDWSFPKGHVEAGEDYQQAAVREVEEEIGIEVKLVKELPAFEYKNQAGQPVICYFYLMYPQNHQAELVAENPDQEELEWVEFEKVGDKIPYLDLRKYFTLIKDDLG